MGFFYTFIFSKKEKMKTYLILIFLTVSYSSFAQEDLKKLNSLHDQFDNIYRTSTSYQEYKVISKERFQKLKLNVLDSIKNHKDIISNKESLYINETQKTKTLQNQLNKIKLERDEALLKEDSILLFGMPLKKTSYNLILWSIIIILLIGLVYFIFKFFRSNILTKEAQNNLSDVEEEFNIHRKKSLEREQKLRRQLQDEINKQRNV